MVAEIIKKYDRFHDAIVFGIDYQLDVRSHKRSLVVNVQALNRQNQNWERIRLVFKEVVKFRFLEGGKINSTVVFEAYIKQEAELIIFDFFALQVDGRDLLAEDPDSTFVVHCKELEFELAATPPL